MSVAIICNTFQTLGGDGLSLGSESSGVWTSGVWGGEGEGEVWTFCSSDSCAPVTRRISGSTPPVPYFQIPKNPEMGGGIGGDIKSKGAGQLLFLVPDLRLRLVSTEAHRLTVIQTVALV